MHDRLGHYGGRNRAARSRVSQSDRNSHPDTRNGTVICNQLETVTFCVAG